MGVICGTLRRAQTPLAFLQDRVIRIFPALWASILVIAALGMVTHLGEFEGVTFPTLAWWLPANLLALPGILPMEPLHPAAWSLSYEMAFYLVCAGVWRLRRRPLILAVAPWGVLAMLAFYPRGLFFVSGILIAEAMFGGRWLPAVRWPLAWLAVFLFAWHEIQILSEPRHIIMTTLFDWAGDVRLPLAGVALTAATLAFAGIAAGEGVLGWLLRTRVMQYMGTVSYSFYIWHPVIMAGVKLWMRQSGVADAAGPGAQALFLVLALPPSLLAAHVSQRTLERGASLWLRSRLHHPVSSLSAG